MKKIIFLIIMIAGFSFAKSQNLIDFSKEISIKINTNDRRSRYILKSLFSQNLILSSEKVVHLYLPIPGDSTLAILPKKTDTTIIDLNFGIEYKIKYRDSLVVIAEIIDNNNPASALSKESVLKLTKKDNNNIVLESVYKNTSATISKRKTGWIVTATARTKN